MNSTIFEVDRPQSISLQATNYSPVAERFRLANGRRAPLLRDLSTGFGNSFGQVFTRVDCQPEFGVELASQVDIFAAEPAPRVIRRDSMARPEAHLVRRGQILIAGAGQVGESTLFGRPILADKRLAGKYLGPDIVSINFAEDLGDLSLYVYALLLSETGLSLIRSTAYGTSIPRIRLDLLGTLPIALPDDDVVCAVASKIRCALKQREIFAEQMAAARAPIEQLPLMQAALGACADRKAQVGVIAPPFRTLGAWNHVSTGEALELLKEGWHARLGDVVPPDGIFKGLRFARIPCKRPFGIDLLSQRDVFLIRPIPQRVVHPGYADRFLFAPEGSLLVGGAGTLGEGEIFGRAVYVSDDSSGFAVTEDMLRIQPQGPAAPFIYAFLSTLVGRRMLRSTAVGTKILRMRPDLLRDLPIPDVDGETRALTSRHLTVAMRARDEANRAESEAVRLIETEVIPAWLS